MTLIQCNNDWGWFVDFEEFEEAAHKRHMKQLATIEEEYDYYCNNCQSREMTVHDYNTYYDNDKDKEKTKGYIFELWMYGYTMYELCIIKCMNLLKN